MVLPLYGLKTSSPTFWGIGCALVRGLVACSAVTRRLRLHCPSRRTHWYKHTAIRRLCTSIAVLWYERHRELRLLTHWGLGHLNCLNCLNARSRGF